MDPHRRPAPRFTFRLDTAAVQLRDVLHDREPEPRAAELAMARFVRAIESLEDARQIAGRNSRSVIGNTQADPIIIARRTYPDAPVWRREFHRVVEQIVNDLLQPALVHSQRRQVVGHVELGLQIFCGELSFPVAHDTAQKNRRADRRQVECHARAFEARQAQHVIDEQVEPV